MARKKSAPPPENGDRMAGIRKSARLLRTIRQRVGNMNHKHEWTPDDLYGFFKKVSEDVGITAEQEAGI